MGFISIHCWLIHWTKNHLSLEMFLLKASADQTTGMFYFKEGSPVETHHSTIAWGIPVTLIPQRTVNLILNIQGVLLSP